MHRSKGEPVYKDLTSSRTTAISRKGEDGGLRSEGSNFTISVCSPLMSYTDLRQISPPTHTRHTLLGTGSATTMTIPIHLPFLFHIIVELPASIGFFLYPSATLTAVQPHAHSVIRQYALLLAATNLVAWTYLFEDSSPSSGRIAAALGVYHVGPIIRSWNRTKADEGPTRMREGWRGPWLHLGVHVVCATALMGEALGVW